MASSSCDQSSGGALLDTIPATTTRDETRRRRPARQRTQLQLAIFAGGIAGALARSALSRALPWSGHGWPWATFAVNLAGTLFLGYVVTRLQERLPPSTFRRPLLGTGFCGALTTFSTMQVELITLVRHHEAAVAAAYLGASLTAGLVGVYLASALTRRVR
jgi:fluoride exporter